PIALGEITWKYYFVFVAWNILVTIPTIFFFFKETNQKSLEDIDLLFGERALGTLPEHLQGKEVEETTRQESVPHEKAVGATQAELHVHSERTK
ncbi:hypothetical protein KC352_g25929, partial [Hortaea werneckii]